MTYCLGWKTKHCAYLVADTATTSGRPLSNRLSSFGEQHVEAPGANVEEGALKILATEHAALTLCGDSRLGYSIYDSFGTALEAGAEPRDALQQAVASNVVSTPPNLSLLCVFMEDNVPRLVSFNRNQDSAFADHEIEEIIQLGSLNEADHIMCQISDSLIKQLATTDLDGEPLLACAVGLCQSFGLSNILVEKGVGGTFAGGFVDALGFHWQADITYLLYSLDDSSSFSQGDSVFVFVRDSVMVVRSVLADGPARILATSRAEPLATVLARAKRADLQCLEAARGQEVEYLIFLSTRAPIITVVQMARKREHRYVVIHPWIGDPEGTAPLPMSFGPILHWMLRGCPEVLDAPRPAEDAVRLGASWNYVPFLHPRFDLRHVGFEAEFYEEEEDVVELPEEIAELYEHARDTAPIFIQGRDGVGFGAAHLLHWRLMKEGKELIDFIPEHEKRNDGSVFSITFPITFTKRSFRLETTKGRKDLKELRLLVEITWLPDDAKRPRLGDFPVALLQSAEGKGDAMS